jgi:hypothetical protein
MSTDSKEDVPNEEDNIPLYDDRDLILSKLNDAIEYLHNKALKGRVMDAQNEKVRIAWFKALAYACSIYNQIKRDTEFDELKEEVEALKNQIDNLEK